MYTLDKKEGMTLDFDAYREKIVYLLYCKAKNNVAREAIVELRELNFSIKATNDLTNLFQVWLDQSGMIEESAILGKGCIRCIVKKEILKGDC